ncbi:TetR family transcriptional regulator [Rhodococcus sp. WMMA185]|uniref:TetR family transcriptional regulator n=1 Tax=Rhodococcus sp. WMMA185 TaxID=679318 RepID=UPI0008789AFE|nr:TetR family transcriptional regulator [Rhodococcus sp. WMMA185]AOW93397.1 TetR family transcriptional regulator [Rhodococcus sp. WMMA185]
MNSAGEPLVAGGDGLLTLLRDGQLPSRGAKAPQRERYQRVVAAAMELASEGGYEAVQMRAIADRAQVALGTVYRYFPSKNHMLVMGLLMVFDGLRERFEDVEIPGETPSERILFVLRKNTEVLEKDRLKYEAMVRAFMFADASATAELDAFGALMTEMFAKSIGVDEVSDDQLNAIRVIGDVWMSSLVSWVAGRISVDEVMAHLALAVRLVFRRLGG